MTFREALLDAWALIAPVECVGCCAPDRAICDECATQLEAHPALRSTPGGLRVITALRYEGVVRHALLSYKEQQRTDVAPALARSLAAAVQRAAPAGVSVQVVPVPTSRGAYRRRGYDPVRLLVRKAGFVPHGVLRASRGTATQKTLGIVDRADNVRGAFAARRDLTGGSFVLVDDILTTGATLDEAARAVSAAGGTVLGAATLAFTPRLFSFRDNGHPQDYRGAKGAQ